MILVLGSWCHNWGSNFPNFFFLQTSILVRLSVFCSYNLKFDDITSMCLSKSQPPLQLSLVMPYTDEEEIWLGSQVTNFSRLKYTHSRNGSYILLNFPQCHTSPLLFEMLFSWRNSRKRTSPSLLVSASCKSLFCTLWVSALPKSTTGTICVLSRQV